MSIKVQETHRIGDRVHLEVYSDDGKVIYTRYEDASDWDSDPESVAAMLSKYLDSIPEPVQKTGIIRKDAVILSDKQVQDKVTEVRAKMEERARVEEGEG